MEIARLLDAALRAQGIPIIGVSIGSPTDRSQWVIQYAPSTTEAQRAAGEDVRQTFDPANPSLVAADLDAEATTSIDTKAIKAAVICALWGRLGRQPTGPEIASERTRFMTIYKSLP